MQRSALLPGLLASLTFALAGLSLPATAAPIRQYEVVFTADPPTVDGVVSAGEWDAAEPATGGFTLLREADGTPDGENNRWRALWDGSALYLLLQSDYSNWAEGSADSVDFGQENLNFYFDPNTDGEANAVPPGERDGYQISLNQWLGTSLIAAGQGTGTAFFGEAGINSLWGNQGEWEGPRGMLMVQNNGESGGLLEVRIPWSDFDASAEIESGLHHPDAPTEGDIWYFNIARISSDPQNFLPVWNWNDSPSFAARPHGEIQFVPEPGGFPAAAAGLLVLAAGARQRRPSRLDVGV